jgi:hypothetical protein
LNRRSDAQYWYGNSPEKNPDSNLVVEVKVRNQPASKKIDIATQPDTLTSARGIHDVMRVCSEIDKNTKIIKRKNNPNEGKIGGGRKI